MLGDEARDNGLKYSLLQRLQVLYKKYGGIAEEHIVSLNTNYRCRREIVNLFNDLAFYESTIKMCPNYSESYQAKYPLTFICSSITSTMNPKLEARLVLNEVEDFCKVDRKSGRICLATATRTQVSH